MTREPQALQDRTFDVVIVGGGITGACLAHDATLRGLSVALIERHDFGHATSAASSKLLHGGIRYLQQARIDKVRESARERARLHRIAPHLTRWVPFLIPTQKGLLRGRWFLGCGVWCYEQLTRREDRVLADPAKRAPRGGFHSRAELVRRVPALGARPDLTGAHVLWESHVHSTERMTLAFVKTAVRGGAVAVNYIAADGLLKVRDRVQGVRAVDQRTDDRFDIRARVVVNAAGPWISSLNERLDVGHLKTAVRGFSKGAHIVTRQVTDTFALALPTVRQSSTLVDRGGRHIFVIPWRNHSLIGTSDRPFEGRLDEVRPLEEDIVDLLDDVKGALPAADVTRADVSHAYAGLYPLTARALRSDVYQGTGDYQVIDHGQAGGSDGVVSVLGAKYTTARGLAERATDVVCARLGRVTAPCRTGSQALVGGAIDDVERFTDETVARYANRLEGATVAHLVRQYGTETDVVVAAGERADALGRASLQPLCADRETTGAEVRFAVEEEMAVTLADVVFRRTGLGTIGNPGRACLDDVAEIMASRLGWTVARREDEIRHTQAQFPISNPGDALAVVPAAVTHGPHHALSSHPAQVDGSGARRGQSK